MNEEKYNGWIISNNFWKRSLAIFGHYIVGVIMFYLVILGFILGIMLIGLMI